MPRPVLLVRADGDTTIGSGHVMRCLALAQCWLRHGDAVLLSARLDPSLARRAERQGVKVHRIPLERDGPEAMREAASVHGATAVVIDGYHLDPTLQTAVEGLPCLLVDDHGRTGHHGASGVVDGHFGSRAEDHPSRVPVLAGPRYALLRPSFGPAALPAPVDAPAAEEDRPTDHGRVLVSLGGGAPPDLVRAVAQGVAQAVAKVRQARATVVLAGTQADGDALEADLRDLGVNVVRDADELAPLLRGSTLAVLAAGTTVLEAAATGTPMVVLVLADNQVPVLDTLVRLGLAEDVPRDGTGIQSAIASRVGALLDDRPRRQKMARRGPGLVDGRGARRVCAWLRARTVHVRKALPGDAFQVLAWANDPVTRAMSFSSAPIPPEEHLAWWRRRLEDPASHLYLAEHEGPLGFIWFRVEAGVAELSVNVAPGRRGQGWGPAVVRAGTQRLFQDVPGVEVHAWVRHTNRASRSAFLDADFDEEPPPAGGAPREAWLFTTRPGPAFRP